MTNRYLVDFYTASTYLNSVSLTNLSILDTCSKLSDFCIYIDKLHLLELLDTCLHEE